MGLELSEASSGSELERLKHQDFIAGQVHARPNPFCYLCGSRGQTVYEGLQDRLFGAPGAWNFRLCFNVDCGLIWLDPVPVENEMGKVYTEYYTHAVPPTTREAWLSRLLRKSGSVLLAVLDPLRGQRKRLSLMLVGDVKPGKLLDVGCGNGIRLAQLRSLGWDVCGQELDPQAVSFARETLGLRVELGGLEDIRFPEQFFDCVTLNHVIEHVHDPIRLLKECRRVLRTNGRLVVVTPNSRSFAHKHFGQFWRGLEPPRHIHLFSPKTLSTIAAKAGFTVTSLSTTVANASTFVLGSRLVENGSVSAPSSLGRKFADEIYALGHLYRSVFEHARDRSSGEECVLQAMS